MQLDGYGNGRSEQSGQLWQLSRAPDMSGKVRTTWISDDIGTCPEKKVWNSVPGKYRTSLHLFTGCQPGTDGQLSRVGGVTRHRTSLQLGHTVTPCHVWCHGMTMRHQIRCQWHISVQQATKMYQWIWWLLFSGPFPSTSTRCSLSTSWLWWI